MQAYHGLVLNEGEPTPPRKRNNEEGPPPPLKKRKPDLDQSQVLFLKWIVSTYQPWSIVESSALRSFHRSMSDSFLTPTTEELIRLAMDHVETVKLEVRRRLKACDRYSLFCHQFQCRGVDYTTVAVSFCTHSMERCSLTLGVTPTKCDRDTVVSLLDQYSLSTSKITSVTLKCVPEAVNLQIGGEEPCVLHKMESVIMETLSSQRTIQEIVNNLSSAVAQTSGWLRSGSLVAQLPPPKDTSAVKSLYMALQAYLSSQSNPEKEQATWKADDGDKVVITVLSAIFKPFYDAHKTLSEEAFPTVGLAIPVFRRINDVLSQLKIDEIAGENPPAKALNDVKDFYASLHVAFSKVFAFLLEEDPPGMWTIPLDPRLIHMGGLSEKEKKAVVSILIDKVSNVKLSEHKGVETSTAATAEESGKAQAKQLGGEETTMGGIFWGDDTGESDKTGNSTETSFAEARSNVERYFSVAKSHSRIEDPLSWWNTNQVEFPELSELARIWLGAAAVGPETDGRVDYSEGNIEIIAFLHDNAHLI